MSIKSLNPDSPPESLDIQYNFHYAGFLGFLLYLKQHTETILAAEIKEASLLWQKNIFTVSAHLAPIHHSNLDFILARRKLDGIDNITATS